MVKLRWTKDFKEFLQLLNSKQIEYLLIGGYAVGLYGYVRGTKDIDVWVAVNPINEQRLREALIEFAFPPETLPTPLFDPVKTTLRLGVQPDMLEILSKISGVEFAACYERRVMMDAEGIPVPVISLDDLLVNKMASGRRHDLADVEKLRKRHQR